MNYGSSVRLQAAQTRQIKPVIFWEQQAIEAKKNRNRKKFGYKEKVVKHPLRSKVAPAPEVERKVTSNKPINKTRNNPHARPRDVQPKPQTDVNSVTLTQKQLDAILETISHLTVENQDLLLKNTADAESLKQLLDETSKKVSEKLTTTTGGDPTLVRPSHNNYRDTEDRSHVVLSRADIPGLGGSEVALSYDAQHPEPVTNNTEAIPDVKSHANPYEAQAAVQEKPPIPTAHMTKAEIKRRQWELERAEEERLKAQAASAVAWSSPVPHQQQNVQQQNYPQHQHHTQQQQNYPQQQHHTQQHFPQQQQHLQQQQQQHFSQQQHTQQQQHHIQQPPADMSPHPPPPLSKFELKRLQWEKEKAEKVENFDPWGRPGAGAPVRDTGGNVLADFNTRKSQDFHEARGSKQAWAENHTQPEYLERSYGAVSGHQASPSWAMNQPAAVRSSFTTGSAAPDEQQFNSIKEIQKKQWLADLEKQKEEKRLQKLREKQGGDVDDRWADRFSNYKPVALPDQSSYKPATLAEQERISSAPTAPGQPPSYPTQAAQELNNSQNASYLRGQNAPLDPVTKKEMEDKRKKYQEHQDALRAQLEEKERKKREERERRQKEEREEEEKLAKEREELQAQFDMEKRKQREKEEVQRRRVDMLKEAMDKAQEEAEREKHQRRLHRLQQGGHDTSHLQANFEAKMMTPRIEAPGKSNHHQPQSVEPSQVPGLHSSVTHVAPSHVPGLHPPVTHVQPAYVPGLHPTPRQEQEYIENRVLTPSMYRHQHGTPRKEFGVQTDPSLLEKIKGLKEDTETEIQYGGPFRNANNKKVRIQSAPEEKENTVVKKGPVKISERPRWGAPSQSRKKALKQSERDIALQQRREEAQARRLARQQEMLDMAQRNAPRASNKTTNASRARSLSRNRPDDAYSHASSPDLVEANRIKQRNSSPESADAHERRSRLQEHIQAQSRLQSHPKLHNQPPNHANKDDLYKVPSPPPPPLHVSPPVPAVRHNKDPYNDNMPSSRTDRYSDSEHFGNTSFVPFVRTHEILDPAHAGDPVPISRETTDMQNVRQAYQNVHQPASYGAHIENYEDKPIHDPVPAKWAKDPIMNPSAVKDHPTPRQDRILQQLSDLRRGLRQKQRELEVGMSTMSLNVDN